MKLLKVALILILLTTIALTAFGCARSFTYTYYVDSVGAVHRDYLLVYDRDALDAEIVKEQAIRAMENYIFSQKLEDYARVITDVEGEVKLEITFPSATEYYIFLGYTGKEENEPLEPTASGFLNRYDENLSSFLTESNIALARTVTSEEYRDFLLNCEFYQVYGTTSKLTSSNGEVEEKDGVYYHKWKVQYGEDADMKISRYSLNGVLLFSIVICVFVLSLVAIFVIIFIKRKKDERGTAEIPPTGGDGMTPAE